MPAAEAAGSARAPSVFATIPDDHTASVVYGPDGNVYVGSEHGIWRLGYTSGALSAASIVRIASVRTGLVAPNTDGDNHTTTSLAISGATIYAGVGSDCNACTEIDPQRASVQEVALSGGATTTKAQNYRNPATLATDPTTGFVWAGGPGQDNLPYGHPYEELDDVSPKPGVVNYGWPNCYDDRLPVAGSGADCSSITLPAIVFPAYGTPLGAAFYRTAAGTYVFPANYQSGMFVSLHGSWHTTSDGSSPTDPSAVQPQVVYVPFASGMPASPVNWTNPTTQYQVFFGNFGTTASSRIGRPTGLAVGVQGSLFVADDLKGNIYRIRPTAAGTQSLRGRR